MNMSLTEAPEGTKRTGMNVVYNDTATRLAEFIVTGLSDNQGDKEIKMVGIQCLGSCVEDVE